MAFFGTFYLLILLTKPTVQKAIPKKPPNVTNIISKKENNSLITTLRSQINGGVLISRGVGNLCKI